MIIPGDFTTDQLFDEWTLTMRERGLAARTMTERVRIIRQVSSDVGRPAHTFTTDDLVTWGARPLELNSRHTYRSTLRVWHRWLVLNEVRADDPTAKLERIKRKRSKPRPTSTTHLNLALDKGGLRRRTRMMVWLGALQGFRVHEIAKVKGADFNLIDMNVRVVGKGGVESVLPLHPAIAAEVTNWPRGYWFPSYLKQGQPVTAKNVSAVVAAALTRGGAHATGHQLRHWLGTELVRSGVDLRTVQEILRHACLNTTAIYTAVNDEQKRAALSTLPQICASRAGDTVAA